MGRLGGREPLLPSLPQVVGSPVALQEEAVEVEAGGGEELPPLPPQAEGSPAVPRVEVEVGRRMGRKKPPLLDGQAGGREPPLPPQAERSPAALQEKVEAEAEAGGRKKLPQPPPQAEETLLLRGRR